MNRLEHVPNNGCKVSDGVGGQYSKRSFRSTQNVIVVYIYWDGKHVATSAIRPTTHPRASGKHSTNIDHTTNTLPKDTAKTCALDHRFLYPDACVASQLERGMSPLT